MTTLEALNNRIDKMGVWAAEASKRLDNADKAAALYLQINEAGMAEELALMWRRYESPLENMTQFKKDLVAKDLELAEIDDEIDLIESQAFLDISFAINDDGKAKYTNDAARKAAVKVALASNDDYKSLTQRRQLIEASVKNIKLDIEYLESNVKEFYARNRAIMARIEFDTAVINNLKGDK